MKNTKTLRDTLLFTFLGVGAFRRLVPMESIAIFIIFLILETIILLLYLALVIHARFFKFESFQSKYILKEIKKNAAGYNVMTRLDVSLWHVKSWLRATYLETSDQLVDSDEESSESSAALQKIIACLIDNLETHEVTLMIAGLPFRKLIKDGKIQAFLMFEFSDSMLLTPADIAKANAAAEDTGLHCWIKGQTIILAWEEFFMKYEFSFAELQNAIEGIDMKEFN